MAEVARSVQSSDSNTPSVAILEARRSIAQRVLGTVMGPSKEAEFRGFRV